MKTKFILSLCMFLSIALSQATAQQGINYKAIINDTNGAAIVNTEVTIQFTILENGTTEVYKETHTPTTDANGIVIVNIGEGTVLSGVFNDIDWGSNPHFLNTQINTGGGLTDMGTTEFKTVPYALHSKTAGNAINTAGLNPGDLLMFDGDAFVPATFNFYYRDNDLDEYGDESVFVFSPVKPDGFALIGRDCDDSNENVNPEIEEICDGIDNNCDGEIDEGCDLDQDGYSVNDGDCDDDNPNVNPGEIEICSDGIDNNCDGEIDEGCDLDQDGYSVNDGDCNDHNPTIHPNATETCDGLDNNCDGLVDNLPESTFDNNRGTITTASNLGGVCGDENCIVGPSIYGIGEGWYKVQLKECNSSLGTYPLKFKAKITENINIHYKLLLYNSDGDLIDQSDSNNTVFYEFTDYPVVDDSEYLYIEIQWMYGSSCEEWHLQTWGGCDQ